MWKSPRSQRDCPQPGPDRLCVEVTDASATGQNHCLDFDSSAGSQLLTPADERYFKALSLGVR